MTDLNRTPLHALHIQLGAKMVPFAGYEMPVQYPLGVKKEHEHARQRCGLFDVSHMGRIEIRGADAEQFIDGLTTRKVAGMGAGRIRYSLLCNSEGGILDDILVYRPPGDSDQFLLVVNASNRVSVLQWIEERRGGATFEIDDQTLGTAMLAFQGPMAIEKINPLLDFDLATLKYFCCRNAKLGSQDLLVSRTGYTGEDGCELIVPAEKAEEIWSELHELEDVSAAGLGARDTLRLEAAMPLYGHELSLSINPAQTGLDFACTLKGRDFVGKTAIEEAAGKDCLPVRVGLVLEGRRAAREGDQVLAGEEQIGTVTSGTFSPTLQQPIAMAYIKREHAESDSLLSIDIRGKSIPATVCELPFYRR